MSITFNGKPFDPDDFTNAVMSAAVEQIKTHLHETITSVRHPSTGEFPVVHISGTSLENISARVEASPDLLKLVAERVDLEDQERMTLVERTPAHGHKAFLSYGWEDSDLAMRIAQALQANGIETWWAEWEIRAGDSLRQKIDEGLSTCTDFVVLLTPKSHQKPWVNQEMDAGLVRKLESGARFIPLRSNLPVSALPPLFKGMLSPSIDNFDTDVQSLIHDILGVSRKPELGPLPSAIASAPATGYSAAATAIAKVFVESTANASLMEPMLSVHFLITKTLLSEDDVIDGLHELGDMVDGTQGTVWAKPELYVQFDKYFKGWDPAEDGLVVAADLHNGADMDVDPQILAENHKWEPRRLNAAIAYLTERRLIDSITLLNMGPWMAVHLRKTDATRRFVKSRQ
jgi:TIR domain